MKDFLSAAALAVVLEGLLYALFPNTMKRMMARVMEWPDQQMRVAGIMTAAIGVGAVWLVMRFFD